LIAGTIFAATKVPLGTWFRAMYHLTQSKGATDTASEALQEAYLQIWTQSDRYAIQLRECDLVTKPGCPEQLP
jgi:hypothetical protein